MYAQRAAPPNPADFPRARGNFGSVVIQIRRDQPLQNVGGAMSPFPAERSSTAPVAMSTGTHSVQQKNPFAWPSSWASMSVYLVAGVALGLLLIVALTVTRSSDPEKTAAAGVVTDNVVHLHSKDIGTTCWSGAAKDGPARVTVALEVGLDGKVRYAAASGESPTMRGCVESHVKGWEFLPQAQAQAMVLPFEIDRR